MFYEQNVQALILSSFCVTTLEKYRIEQGITKTKGLETSVHFANVIREFVNQSFCMKKTPKRQKSRVIRLLGAVPIFFTGLKLIM